MMEIDNGKPEVNNNSTSVLFAEHSTKFANTHKLLVTQLKFKKRVTNFHSIADLIKKDSDTGDVSPRRIADMNDQYSEELDVHRRHSLTPSSTPCAKKSVAKKRCNKSDSVTSAMKKLRTMYKADQIDILEKLFGQTQYPDAETVDVVSKRVGISDSKIKVWFQNKRARCRPKSSDPRLASGYTECKLHSNLSNLGASFDNQRCYVPGYNHIHSGTFRGLYPPMNMVAPYAPFLLHGLPFSPDLAAFVKNRHLQI